MSIFPSNVQAVSRLVVCIAAQRRSGVGDHLDACSDSRRSFENRAQIGNSLRTRRNVP